MLGNNDQSISIVGDNCVGSSPVSINSILSETSANRVVDPVTTSVARGAAKLKTICMKKDVNLTTYPGVIQLSMNLSRRSNPTSAVKVSLSQQS
jgi:hypothetical protein